MAYIHAEVIRMKDNSASSIAASLAESINALRSDEAYMHYLQLMARFHHYSSRNTLLIYHQMPEATYVAGYRTWQDTFDRHVRRGEKAIRIFAPMKKKNDEDLKGFRCISVFDVSQTEGRPLPSLVEEKIRGVIEDEEAFTAALIHSCPVPVVFRKDLTVHGLYDPRAGQIQIRADMESRLAIRTLIHETAHAILHGSDREKSRRRKEVEAESVAYTVSSHYGLDTSAYSFGYIAGWMEGMSPADLSASFHDIVRTSDTIIAALDDLLLPKVSDHVKAS
jgi:hypothetical protein